MKAIFRRIQAFFRREALVLHLGTGDSFPLKKISGSGYIAAPMGAYILSGGSHASRDLVGKYVLAVEYEDGHSGLVAQEEILEITNCGRPVPYGNPHFPGHPDYDPASRWSHEDYLREQMNAVLRKLDS